MAEPATQPEAGQSTTSSQKSAEGAPSPKQPTPGTTPSASDTKQDTKQDAKQDTKQDAKQDTKQTPKKGNKALTWIFIIIGILGVLSLIVMIGWKALMAKYFTADFFLPAPILAPPRPPILFDFVGILLTSL